MVTCLSRLRSDDAKDTCWSEWSPDSQTLPRVCKSPLQMDSVAHSVAYLSDLFCAAFRAAAHAVHGRVVDMWFVAYVSGTVTYQHWLCLPLAHNNIGPIDVFRLTHQVYWLLDWLNLCSLHGSSQDIRIYHLSWCDVVVLMHFRGRTIYVETPSIHCLST